MHPWGRVGVNIVDETRMEKHVQIIFSKTKRIKDLWKVCFEGMNHFKLRLFIFCFSIPVSNTGLQDSNSIETDDMPSNRPACVALLHTSVQTIFISLLKQKRKSRKRPKQQLTMHRAQQKEATTICSISSEVRTGLKSDWGGKRGVLCCRLFSVWCVY